MSSYDQRAAAASNEGRLMNRDLAVTNRRPFALLALAGSLAVILGAKLLLIKLVGSDLPFWDQWDAEGLLLYKPYLTETLTISDLLGRHNEHRILFTRLMSLTVLALTGSWNPIFEMILNAMIHVLALGVLIFALEPRLGKDTQVPVAIFCMVIHVVPFGWENTLWGFQLHFYCLLLFGISSVALYLIRRPSRRGGGSEHCLVLRLS